MGERRSSVIDEFAGAELHDARRSHRLGAIAERLMARPDVSFPRALVTEADLEGFYRFVRNEAVTFGALSQPHVAATARRAAEYDEVCAVHDTTEFRFSSAREDLGCLSESGHGFLGHFTLAVSLSEIRDPLGMLAIETWVRGKKTATALRRAGMTYAESRKLPNEQDRWLRSIDKAERAAAGGTSLIHVMDSEADDYALMSGLVSRGHRWVIRLCYDRVLAGAKSGKTKEFLATREVKCTRTVELSARRRQPGGGRVRGATRSARTATLALSSAAVTFRRPQYCTDELPTIDVNVVHVREIDAPEGEQPVEWLLLTTDPIETEEQVLQVVDIYRARWRIEEFFKALKTGCAFERRQLESRETMLKALAIFTPIAWTLLRLRSLSQLAPTASAKLILTDEQLVVLRAGAERPLPESPTVSDALVAIARLGGHLRSNGDPGWQVLARGFEDLLKLVAGYRLARRCDPS